MILIAMLWFSTFLLSNKPINAKALNEGRPEDEPVKEGRGLETDTQEMCPHTVKIDKSLTF